jgi:uncharacterized protein (TIGR00725 family)
MQKVAVGVMGSSETDALTPAAQAEVRSLAERLGAVLAHNGVVLITGATTGLPNLVANAYRANGGGLVMGISPAANKKEHTERYRLPAEGADVIVYTGFGLKGRNVVNVRSADIVVIFGGATGTLNEFTIAYDEGKVIGVLEGSGGIADRMRDVIDFCNKACTGVVVFEREPEALLQRCLDALNRGR